MGVQDGSERASGRVQKATASPSGEAVTVLLVEADTMARRVACEQLVLDGFRVVEAASADTASEILALRDDIVVVVADVDAPGIINGAQLAQLLVRQAPWISVVSTSAAPAAERPGFGFFTKPYSAETLVKTVRAAAAAALHLRRAASAARTR